MQNSTQRHKKDVVIGYVGQAPASIFLVSRSPLRRFNSSQRLRSSLAKPISPWPPQAEKAGEFM